MEYKLAIATSPTDLAERVNDLLKEGWELYEGPAICPGVGPIATIAFCAQALTKKDKPLGVLAQGSARRKEP